MINCSVWECSCGWITRHQLVFCPECGKTLEHKKVLESEYYNLSKIFFEKTGWQWYSIKYDPYTGRVIK